MRNKIGASIAAVSIAVMFSAVPALAQCQIPSLGVQMQNPSGSPFALMLKTEPAKIKIGQKLTAHVFVCAGDKANVERFSVDAMMPEHKHGMNYTPKIINKDNRRYSAHGLLFHMPGLWRLEAAFRADGKMHRFFREFTIE